MATVNYYGWRADNEDIARPSVEDSQEPDSALVSQVSSNLARIRGRIESAGGDPDAVTIVSVTKGFGEASVKAARAVGLLDLGENYAQEMLSKLDAAGDDTRWHFLGPVQRNKVGTLARHVHLWHGVDRVAVGETIARERPGARVLVQVNPTGEASKHGCRPEDTSDLVAALRRLPIEVAGLMAIGPQGPPEAARPGFRVVAELGRTLGLTELSMGMTNDLEVAVQEGATILRIGRALFGPRHRRTPPATVGS